MAADAPGAKPLGFWMCTALIVGNVIGIGIFMLPAAVAPYGLNAFLGWSVVILGCICLAHVFSHLARSLPGEDGPYGYTRRAFGNGAAFFVMWCYWVSVWVTNATIAVGVVSYSMAVLPGLGQWPLAAPVIAVSLIWFFVLINLGGAHASGMVQLICTGLKLLPMAAVLVLGGWVLLSEPQAYLAHVPSTPLSFEATAAAGTIALFSMLGVECATIASGKVDNPERTIPRATMFATLITAAIYIGVMAVPLFLIPQAELAKSSAPFVDLFNRYLAGDSGKWLALFVIISGLGALNGWTLIAAELTSTFANQGVFPAVFKRQNARGAPVLALLLAGVLASAIVAMNYSRSLAQGYLFLILLVTAATLPAYLFCALAMIKLVRRGVVAGSSGKTGLLLLSASGAVVFSLWAFNGLGQEAFWWSVVLGAVSLPVFYGMRAARKTAAIDIASRENGH
jgi:APA family basic amino acid/polyamine antiporter